MNDSLAGLSQVFARIHVPVFTSRLAHLAQDEA
jgi:hypothetical protein